MMSSIDGARTVCRCRRSISLESENGRAAAGLKAGEQEPTRALPIKLGLACKVASNETRGHCKRQPSRVLNHEPNAILSSAADTERVLQNHHPIPPAETGVSFARGDRRLVGCHRTVLTVGRLVPVFPGSRHFRCRAARLKRAIAKSAQR